MPALDRHRFLAAFGRAVRRLRVEAGLSQEQLAEGAGLHPRYVSDIERGHRNPGVVNVAGLASGLGVDLVALMSAVEEERRSGA
jgi:transcriptional regulator with XRE-family HTH domain